MVISPVRVVAVSFLGSWISVVQVLVRSPFDFLGFVPWQLRSSVVEIPWVTTLDFLVVSERFLKILYCRDILDIN